MNNNYFYSKNKHCKCGKLITNFSKQCKSCFVKWQHKNGILNVKGKNNPFYGKKYNYKSGETLKKHYCKCGKEISYKAIKCQKCAGKMLSIKLKVKYINPKNHPAYKGGITFKKYYCIDCKIKEITYSNWHIGRLRCKSCGTKASWKRGNRKYRNYNGKNNPHFGKPASHSKWIKYKGILMRSSWEVAYAKYLDKQQIKWQYEPKTFDLGEITYTPDFYLSNSDTYIEIKGFWRDNAKNKFRLFKKLFPLIKCKLYRKNHLRRMKVLK